MSDESKPRRPRRRRRRGRGEAGDGATPRSQSGERGGGDSGEQSSGNRDSGEQSSRRRRGGAGRGPQGNQRSQGKRADDTSSRRRRRRRSPRDHADGRDERRAPGRDGAPEQRDTQARGTQGPGDADERRPGTTTAAATAAEIDDGWDTASPAPPVALDSADAEVDESHPWGDDADAPTPDVVLDAVLPADPPADDPDPATAYLDDETATGAATAERAADAGSGEQALDHDLETRESRHDPHADIPTGHVRDVVGVKFSAAGRISEYDANGATLKAGDDVVVETDRGTRVGTVAVASVRRPHASGKLKKVVRPATAQDRLILDSNRDRAAAALDMAREAARKKRVNAKIFRAELSFGGTKLVVYYSSEDRVDLRDVQNQLSRKLDCRVELRQVGVRDAAKLIGGIGSCGRELCCSTFLPSFAPVSIKMAKDQNMVLNPTKVSGQCGRLKCCLVYEQETYATMRKGLPKMGKRVITEDGEGRVVEVDVLRQRIRVSLGAGEFRVYPADQVKRKFPPQQQQEQQPPADSAESGEPS